ncbi:MAG TPA: A-type flagellar hook-associated protein 2 [Pseudomonas sp.]|nr:A-type flagellar hook-associated protein 2 [Pseudomonas sp.]
MDIDGMVGAIVAAEKAPKEAQLARLEKATTSKISALGQLSGALSTFQTALNNLNDASLFEERSATSSDSNLVTATAGKTAQNGSYSLKIEQLASGSKTASKVLGSAFTAGAGGSLNIRLGAEGSVTEVKIEPGATLSEIRDALNTQLKDTGITADLVTNPSDGKTRLAMTSTSTGIGKDVQISSDAADLQGLTIGSAALSSDDPDSSGVLEAAGNAKFSINGLALDSESNVIDGAIPDVTFTLLAADKEKTVTVKIDQDRAGVTANVKKFVDAYNALMTTTNSLTSIVKVGEGKEPVTGELLGDSSVRGLLSNIRSEMTTPGSGSFGVLTDLGITTQKDGTLAINDAKLKTALEKDVDAVGTLFTGDTGLMNRLDSKIKGFTASDGVLSQRVSGLNTTINSIDDQREALTLRIEKMQTRLFSQFNAMDSMIGQLLTTSDWLTQTLEGLPGFVKKD